MNTMTPEQLEFEKIVTGTDRLLWKAYQASIHKTLCHGVNLRFPPYRTDALKAQVRLRVSEQEARFAMTAELAKSELLYAVEAPTFETYQFTGQKALSGQTDVSVYWPDGIRMWNVEFKAHGFSKDRVLKSGIQKDIEKLLKEDVDGFWFHTLEGVDNNTLRLVCDAFINDLRDVIQKFNELDVAIPSKTLVFHVCVLRQEFSIEMRFTIDTAKMYVNWLENVMAPIYSVKANELTIFTEANSWRIHQTHQPVLEDK